MNIFKTSAAVRYTIPPQKRREIFEHVKTITEIICQLQQGV